MPKIFFDSLSKFYRTTGKTIKVLDSITMGFPERGIIVIAGKSGVGKTTLIQIIAGLIKPSFGSVFIDGVEISRLAAYELAWFRRKKIGFKPQTPVLINQLSVLENVALPLLLNYVDRDMAYKAAKELLEEFELSERIYHKPTQLSGGEYERVSVAQTIIGNPPIVILDEPTAHLDLETSKKVANIIRRKQREIDNLYIITTIEESLIEDADSIFYLINGKLYDKSFK
ncbi:MAG: ATP-binding cassette domain-containing protein [Candidatus Methanomethyliaceae archaeon]|nr:ATP-binding cassette domain-containing protein [Candidatus Methanomethyliaceae archaeon]MDW7970880.1 ATP-binding cassette domain-containing protein [Nitrososphaerota archaeon]